jgi:hypothetical protein
MEECDEEQEPAGLPHPEGELLLETYSFSLLLSREGDFVHSLPGKDFGFQHIEIDYEIWPVWWDMIPHSTPCHSCVER